ncbi:DUF1097 domain-containing protein [Clostridium colicanis]|uniref:Inner membrane protein YcdZ n=1 Tax=Clostridium colicanis DSM 13634 TaxID=1121305 RepID=A0A151AL33_9CLOT|nr:DUF1097 domain-containing protein [Clostridium colicanis]KYH28230.1 inner membrane protein YcdZ [Clostridium colicanis DSM 13634]
MRKIIAVAISSAFIAVIWTFGSYLLGLSTVAGFLAWSSFFVAGGEIKGVKKALIANLSGIFWGALAGKLSLILTAYVGERNAFTLGNGLGTAAICLQSKIGLVSFIPAGFIGWSALIASGMNFKITAISMICGSFLGLASEKLTDLILIRINCKNDEVRQN